ncbi:hypothetical protein HWV62_8971 [Athelia sp. TMB]|nr:hypothetical protein HWV62_8971 [Athelia sp. TMB]
MSLHPAPGRESLLEIDSNLLKRALMPFPDPEALSSQGFLSALSQIECLLKALPDDLPCGDPSNSPYSLFLDFVLDSEIYDKTEDEVATISEMLKGVFGWNARTTGDGVIVIVERGAPICAITQMFRHFHLKHPGNNVLKKWAIDVGIGAEKVFTIRGLPVWNIITLPRSYSSESISKIPTHEPLPDSAPAAQNKRPINDVIDISGSDHGGKPAKKRAVITAPQPKTGSGRGRKVDPLIERLVTVVLKDGKSAWQCNACSKVRMGNRDVDRIFQHVTTCAVLSQSDPDLFREAINASKTGSLGAQLEAETDNSAAPEPVAKRPTQSTLKLAPLREYGQKEKQEQQKMWQKKVDHVIMRLICVRGLVPHLIDSPEWKELMHLLNGNYNPTSSDTFATNIIPREAIWVHEKTVEVLRKEENLTMTFDGGSTRKPDDYTTAHATTAVTRQSYFLDAHAGQGESHTAVWMKEKLLKNKNVQAMFANRHTNDYNEFEQGNLQYITIVAPLIRSLWSLEAAHANASDTFIFWLVIAASLKRLFAKGQAATGIDPQVARQVTAIYNKRYSEFFTNEVYFVAFTLDPRYKKSSFLKEASRTAISIPSAGNRSHGPIPFAGAYNRVKEYLKNMLSKFITWYQAHPDDRRDPAFANLQLADIVEGLKQQLPAFWQGEWPFNQPSIEGGDPLVWWTGLRFHPQGRVMAFLAIKLFSMLVNSMPDERTNSTFTWFNSPLRGSQNMRTLSDMIQVERERERVCQEAADSDGPESEDDDGDGEGAEDSDGEGADDPAAAEGEGVDAADREDDEPAATSSRRRKVKPPPEAAHFIIDKDIDIDAAALRDLVSVEPVVEASIPTPAARQTAPAVEKVIDWAF